MTAARFYSSTAGEMILQSTINNLATTIIVDTTTGLPGSIPFTLILEPDTPNEELVDVTNVSGTTLTVTRGVDGTAAMAHEAGAKIRHGASARDFREAAEHIGSNEDVHGIGASSNVVGTNTVQTLKNKDLSDSSNTFPSSLATDAEVTSAILAHAAQTNTHGVSGAIVGTTDTQTLTNKTISGGTVNPNVLQKGGVDVPTISEAATLTNKTMSGSDNTFSNIPQSAIANLGTWVNATTSVRSGTGGSAASGSSIGFAKYMKLGKTVWFVGEASCANPVTNVAVMLPSAAGTPVYRYLNVGSMGVFNASGVPSGTQLGVARVMDSSRDRIVCPSVTNAFIDAPAGSSISWNIVYEVE